MIRICVFLGLSALVGCGVDGEPERPTTSIGVGVSNSGVSAAASVGVAVGPVNISVGGVL